MRSKKADEGKGDKIEEKETAKQKTQQSNQEVEGAMESNPERDDWRKRSMNEENDGKTIIAKANFQTKGQFVKTLNELKINNNKRKKVDFAKRGIVTIDLNTIRHSFFDIRCIKDIVNKITRDTEYMQNLKIIVTPSLDVNPFFVNPLFQVRRGLQAAKLNEVNFVTPIST